MVTTSVLPDLSNLSDVPCFACLYDKEPAECLRVAQKTMLWPNANGDCGK